MRVFRLAVVLAFAAGVLFIAPPGGAKSSGWKSHSGTVVAVIDGDTLDVLFADGVVRPVRLYGIDTHEWNECMGPEATARMRQLAPVGSAVTMKGDLTLPLDGLGRDSMRLFRDGKDVTRVMLKEGYGIPRSPKEIGFKAIRSYRKAVAKAQNAGAGIWDPTVCGSGPQQSATIRLRVMYEVDGSDEANPAGEWVEIRNDGGEELDLSGWRLRDASRRTVLVFPNGTTVAAGTGLRVVGGTGSGGGVLYWGNKAAHLERTGDGVYLQDPGDDIRAYVEFPCFVACSDPLQGKVVIAVNYDAEGIDKANINGEWVQITNTSSSTVDLFDYVVERDTYVYHFDQSMPVAPGTSVRLHVGFGSDNGSTAYWGKKRPVFNNFSGTVHLRTLDGRIVAEYSWP
ncbi:MAG: lamin tail domain-containing protein [Acidimicrobiia bacterium]